MFIDSMDYHETHNNGVHSYVFSGECIGCNEKHTVIVRGPDLFRFRQGAFVQEAFPYLPAGDREFLISGTCEKCWDKMFPEEE